MLNFFAIINIIISIISLVLVVLISSDSVICRFVAKQLTSLSPYRI